ncbi:MAG: 2-hydroxychromene-2-carboxylate isomerase [Deltaproteobacteria bacterium]|nr:2-hydroxychromene-2-carboxylate isomerase [Deltaproteobacteria bacterium]
MATLEFFFDCSSPWTYLAFDRIEALAQETGATLVWKPILVGGVFNAVNPSVYETRAKPVPAKARYYGKDLGDWVRRSGLRIGTPKPFPVNSVKAMRGAFFALDAGCIAPYARAVFEAYWGELRDISQDEVLADVVARVGLDRDAYFAAIAAPALKERLRATTDELVARGGFGSPTLFVDGDDMYFGNDRLVLVREALLAKGGAPAGSR